MGEGRVLESSPHIVVTPSPRRSAPLVPDDKFRVDQVVVVNDKLPVRPATVLTVPDQEAKSRVNAALHAKFRRMILESVKNISDTLKKQGMKFIIL